MGRRASSVLALALVGCARPPGVVRLGPPLATRPPPAAFVVRALGEHGVRVTTAGGVPDLYDELRGRFPTVPLARARAGDVVFFDLEGRGCATHAGLVEAVDGGRLTFREERDGQVRRSYADPAEPHSRRDERGRILNSFLRPRRRDDPPGLRYFSGDMLCAVVRASGGRAAR